MMKNTNAGGIVEGLECVGTEATAAHMQEVLCNAARLSPLPKNRLNLGDPEPSSLFCSSPHFCFRTCSAREEQINSLSSLTWPLSRAQYEEILVKH